MAKNTAEPIFISEKEALVRKLDTKPPKCPFELAHRERATNHKSESYSYDLTSGVWFCEICQTFIRE